MSAINLKVEYFDTMPLPNPLIWNYRLVNICRFLKAPNDNSTSKLKVCHEHISHFYSVRISSLQIEIFKPLVSKNNLLGKKFPPFCHYLTCKLFFKIADREKKSVKNQEAIKTAAAVFIMSWKTHLHRKRPQLLVIIWQTKLREGWNDFL